MQNSENDEFCCFGPGRGTQLLRGFRCKIQNVSKWGLAESQQGWAPFYSRSLRFSLLQVLYLCWQLPSFQRCPECSCSFQGQRIRGPAFLAKEGHEASQPELACPFLPVSPRPLTSCMPGWLAGSKIGPGPDIPGIPNRERCIGPHTLYSG